MIIELRRGLNAGKTKPIYLLSDGKQGSHKGRWGGPMKISMNRKTVISITLSAILPVKVVASRFSKRGIQPEKQEK